jgi:hypothetical protein
MKGEVELREEEGPAGLLAVEFLRLAEVLEILMVCPDLKGMLHSFKEVSPLL